MNTLTNRITITLLALTLLGGCQSSPDQSTEQQAKRKIVKKDLLRKKWSCNVKRESDYQISYGRHDVYASLTLPSTVSTSKRLRTDFTLPAQIEDIISIKYHQPGQPTIRLMKGYIPMRVCGDFFVRNHSLNPQTLSVFSDINPADEPGDRVWKIVYIGESGQIITSEKALSINTG